MQAVAFTTPTTNRTTVAVSHGKPALKPQTSDSFNATLGYYGPRDQYFGINTVCEIAHNHIVGAQTNGAYQGQLVQLTTLSDVGGAYARGIGIAGQPYFTGLLLPFNGVGATGNFMYFYISGHVDGSPKKNI